jgi:hypothetical protein
MAQGKVDSRFTRISMIALLVLTSSTARVQAAPGSRSVPSGVWGGEHVVLQVSEKGADVEFDCAHGQITQALTTDEHGDFEATGTFTPEHGGPVRRDETRPISSARYTGYVGGEGMTLTITLGKENVGTFTLTHGSRPMLTKCR